MTIARASVAALALLAACSRARPAPAPEPAPAPTDESQEALEGAVAADPKDARSWYLLGTLSQRNGNCEGAVVAYRRYSELMPKANEPHYLMGVCQQKLGDRAGALASLRRFVAEAPKALDARVTHARKLIATLEAAEQPDAGSAGSAAASKQEPLLTKKKLSGDLRRLVDEGHAHRAVASLEAAGCDLALVWKAAKYNRFVDLQHGTKMPLQARPPTDTVVWCQTRSTVPPACAQVAPIFARVAHPTQPFQVFSGYNDPPFTPRCSGLHDKSGKYVSGEGPGYASVR
ncbi:MAG TPA: tetratricopeptide repeat protein [Polyangia bacterium]|jgi:tetratricopeptide (TPR) repeat protein|nr:tetratricopeptide repeat protein [Polyangia bacterium]